MKNNGFVYIAGPMSTSGEPGPNLHAAAVAASTLMLHGFQAFVPHVTWFLHAICPTIDVSLWQEWDRLWITRCDALLRLPGRSVGADREVAWAEQIGIPVFHSVNDILIHGSLYDREQVSKGDDPPDDHHGNGG